MSVYTNSQISNILKKIRRSVVYVISKEDKYSHLSNDSRLVDKISSSLLGTLYKEKSPGLFVFKEQRGRPDMVSSILDIAEKTKNTEELKEILSNTSEFIKNTEKENNITLSCLTASVVESPSSEDDFEIFSKDLTEKVNDIVYSGSDFKIPEQLNRNDLMFLDFILVAEGTNNNKDHFLAEELKNSYKTLIGMPLVEEHEVTAIKGVFFSSSIVNIKPGKERGTVKFVKSGGRVAVRAGAFLYKKRFPREASLLKSRFEQGLLRFSTEMGFTSFSCGNCKKEFGGSAALCDHLLMRYSVDDPSYTRVPHGLFFIGGSYTVSPAEPSAVALEIKEVNEIESKKENSCVNNVESSAEESFIVDANDKDFDNNVNGGVIMSKMFEYDSVEELLSSKEVQAVIESESNNLSKEEKEALVSASEELSKEKDTLKEDYDKLLSSLEELTEKLKAAEEKISEMEMNKKVSDAIVSLQHRGYNFDSDEAIASFSDRIKNLDKENVEFIVELMANQVKNGSVEEPIVNKESPVTEETPEQSGIVQASKKVNVNPRGVEDTLQNIRNSWRDRIENLNN